MNVLLARLDAVNGRLAAQASAHHDGLTDPDPGGEERWTAGNVFAHLAEFIPYWIAQAGLVIAAWDGTPVPFGRTKADPARRAAIARGETVPVPVYWAELTAGIDALRGFLRALEATAFDAVGVHPTLGEMSLERILDEFLLGHLEQHAGQLEGLARS